MDPSRNQPFPSAPDRNCGTVLITNQFSIFTTVAGRPLIRTVLPTISASPFSFLSQNLLLSAKVCESAAR